VRGHFSFAPVQTLHLSHVSFLLTLQNVKWKRWWVSWMSKESIPWQKSNFKQNNQTQKLRWDLDKPASWKSRNRPNENKADSINVDLQTFIQQHFNRDN
jgi:hypothetical protein